MDFAKLFAAYKAQEASFKAIENLVLSYLPTWKEKVDAGFEAKAVFQYRDENKVDILTARLMVLSYKEDKNVQKN